MEWERGEGLRVSGKVKGISSPARSHHETGGIEKREETLSLRAYTIPGPALTFFFLVQLYSLLNRHVNPHFTDENIEVQRDE